MILLSFLCLMLVLGGLCLGELVSSFRRPTRLVRVLVPVSGPVARLAGAARGAVYRVRSFPPCQAVTRAGPSLSLRL